MWNHFFTLSLQSGAVSAPDFFVFMARYLFLIVCVFLSSITRMDARKVTPKDVFRDSVMNRIYAYSSRYDTVTMPQTDTYAYTKFLMRTNKRNFTLMTVPTMYAIARGAGRNFIGEYYSKVKLEGRRNFTTERILDINTLPHRRSTMTSVLNYLTPSVYDECMYRGNILSPYHRSNRKYYIYSVTPLPFGKAQVYAYPKFKNTQLVSSRAIVEFNTGKIILVDFEGEYDMTDIHISVMMNTEDDTRSLFPKKCDMRANFRFLGNSISGLYTSVYGLPKILPDIIVNREDTAMMNKVRPIPLLEQEQKAFDQYYQKRNANDSINSLQPKKKSFVKDVLWDMIGDNVLNRVKQSFGKENRGNVRISPILNPFYMSYSQRRGFVYKFDLRGSYTFNDDVQLAVRFRAAYSFKRKQLTFNIPTILNYNKKHDGFLQLEFGNGNRISSNVVAKRILDATEIKKDTLTNIPPEKYTDFKDNYLRITNHWMFTRRFGFEIGMVAHHREAVTPEFYQSYNYPSKYRSVAPAIALEWHPLGSRGPVLKADYERSFNGLLGSNISYERVETDIQGIVRLSRRRLLSLRGGTGFYTRKGAHWYFVDYTNFNDNNIPGGWSDDWSGEFEMLNAGWYNASDYYVRSNATYEAPAILAARLPLLGRYIESERFYVNTLFVKYLHPYTEWGYGFTSRAISIGLFAAFKNTEFRGFGFKWTFELFRHW